MKKLISFILVISFLLSGLLPALPASAYKLGDLNGDGKITAADANIMCLVILGKESTPIAPALSDLDKNNKVNSTDANLMAMFFVGKYDLQGYKTVFTNQKSITSDVTVNTVMNQMETQAEEFEGLSEKDITIYKDAQELGLVADKPSAASDNSDKINGWLKSAPECSALVFPEKTYYISKYISVSGRNKLLIKGNNTKLINTGYCAVKMEGAGGIFSVNNCSYLTIEGFEIDYYHQVQLVGVIEKIQKRYTYVRPYAQFTATGEKLPVTGGEGIYTASILLDDGTPGTEHYFTTSGTSDMKLEDAGDGLFRYNYTALGAKGQVVALRFVQNGNIMAISNTQNLTVRDVTVRSNPGAGVGANGDCSDFCFDGFNFEMAAGSEAVFASNVDCIHFSNGLRGKFILKNCTFDGLGDDALNINSRRAITKYFDENDENTFTPIAPDFTTGEDRNVPSGWCRVGDTLVFNAADLHEIGTATVTSFDGTHVTVDALPEGVDATCFVQNESLAPFVVVKNCEIAHGRARGLLIQAKNVLIENCNIHDMRLAAILIAPDYFYWGESGFTDNVLIKNCSFTDVAKQYASGGAIMIAASHDCGNVAGDGVTVHKNISIVENTFKDMECAAVFVRNVANLKMENNTVTNCAGELRQGNTNVDGAIVSEDFASVSVDMSRTIKVHASAYKTLDFICELKDYSSAQQRYNLKAKSIVISGGGKSVTINGSGGTTVSGSDYDLSKVTFSADADKIAVLKEIVKASEVSITVSGTSLIMDVSSPYRDTTVDVSGTTTISGNDLLTLRDIVNACGG